MKQAIFHELERIKKIVEKKNGYPCQIDFTVQNGKLWVLGVSQAKLGSRAKINTTIDFYNEKLININDVVERINIEDILSVSKEVIHNAKNLKLIGKGLPASTGITTGKLYFSIKDIIDAKNENCILCKEEFHPDDIKNISLVKGIICSRGGMTSHAATASRQNDIPCVVGVKDLIVHSKMGLATISEKIIKINQWITIDGSTGKIYIGKGIFKEFDWKQDKYFFSYLSIIKKSIFQNTIIDNNVGKVWIIIDYFLHRIPLITITTNKKRILFEKYVSFKQPLVKEIKKIFSNLYILKDNELKNYQYLIQGFRNYLLRRLYQNGGIGSHYKFYRPLLDPMKCITKNITNNSILYRQLVGEEFFQIGEYLPDLKDIHNIKIWYEIESSKENELWFLDYVNIKGEKIIAGTFNIVGYTLKINNQKINCKNFIEIYNSFRKAEYEE